MLFVYSILMIQSVGHAQKYNVHSSFSTLTLVFIICVQVNPGLTQNGKQHIMATYVPKKMDTMQHIFFPGICLTTDCACQCGMSTLPAYRSLFCMYATVFLLICCPETHQEHFFPPVLKQTHVHLMPAFFKPTLVI